jgi:hypothetical protein
MKKALSSTVVLVAVIAIAAIFLLASYTPILPEASTTTTTTAPLPAKGSLIVAVKDASHKLSRIGTVYALNLTINSIEAHFVGTSENATGQWIVLFSGEKTFDLLQYTDVRAIVGEQELSPGKYTQIRLNLSDSTIKIYNSDMYIYNKTYPLKVPSKELKLVRNFNIEQNKTTVLTLDFDIEQSLEKTDQGYILKPTINVLEESLTKGQRPTNSTKV